MRYLYMRGDSSKRVMHLGGFNPITGDETMEPICRRASVEIDTSCNLPLGRPTCKWCLAEYRRLTTSSR